MMIYTFLLWIIGIFGVLCTLFVYYRTHTDSNPNIKCKHNAKLPFVVLLAVSKCFALMLYYEEVNVTQSISYYYIELKINDHTYPRVMHSSKEKPGMTCILKY
ncbi:uncharacterized protein BO88DRAFT_267700 [Aspergillus vadensis CBS 113365]|uniref:Uncharacterized protein n=1 Tax=Aspergillus vadensis (strain CBS 113365 / IMI 142717 / IBT 24658) TaxID=1448311 RepID=A0A319BCN7_ASPVC|nr:hypothetical protein BO88DRAFT_267700 [Aspergillus vadensis CBS 113365]PYH69791.1 hypothetical protein BO88DRAFT_267700 [Aspergillus vadensis CBS 113365]